MRALNCDQVVEAVPRLIQITSLRHVSKKQIKEDFAVGITKNEATKNRRYAVEQSIAKRIEVRDVPVMHEHPVSKLERVRIEDGVLPLRRLAQMSEYGLRGHNARHPSEEVVHPSG